MRMDEIFDRMKQEIADEYERRSAKLADCLKSMEGIYEKQKQEFHRKHICLENENRELKKKLESVQCAKFKHDEADSRRVKELEAKIKDLNEEVQKSKELVVYRRKRDDWAKMKLEAEVKALRKKATVGWMLGSLWEVSLQGDELGETISMVKMLRKLQKDLERESWNVTGGSTDTLDKDVQVLLDNVHAVIQKSGGTTKGGKADDSIQANNPASPRAKGPGSPRANGPASPRGDHMTRSSSRVRSPRSPTSPISPRTVKAPPPTNEAHKAVSSKWPTSPTTTAVQSGEETGKGKGDIKQMLTSIDANIRTLGRSDIKEMLSSIDANIRTLLESERKRISDNENAPKPPKPTSPPPPAKQAWKT